MDGDLPARLAEGTVLPQAVAAALAELLPHAAPAATALRRDVPPGLTARALWEAGQGGTHPLARIGRRLSLDGSEALALVLLAETERNPVVPAALRALQGDHFGPWPGLATIGRLLAVLGQAPAGRVFDPARLAALGLVRRVGERMPAAEERLALTPPLLWALGLPSAAPGPHALSSAGEPPPSWREAARELAERNCGRLCLVLREGDPGDRRLFAALLAEALGLRAVLLETAEPGLGAAAALGGWLPVEAVATAPGHRSTLLPLDGHDGPRVALTEADGGVVARGWDCCDIPLPPFTPAERAAQWDRLLPGTGIGARHAGTRLGPVRLAAVAARARAGAPGDEPFGIRAAMGEEYRADLEPQARLVPEAVTNGRFVADGGLRADLGVLLARCHYRAQAADNPVAGVRALLSGPSGTGKTLAVSWLSTALDLPLFRLDLSAVVSKYIGETEENLARILDRAETGDMVLLMDEADSLFAARTETKDSSDRFANNQTNYLLSRIESFEGIAILTSNGPERFDSAFARRLDQVIEVPLPAARERRAIWRVHLGSGHALAGAEINRLAAMVDVAGGHIRNIAQTARVLAAHEARPISFGDVRRGVAMEYAKLHRAPPGGLDR